MPGMANPIDRERSRGVMCLIVRLVEAGVETIEF
jgi:hypothetical protein